MAKEGAERFEANLSMTEGLALYGALEDLADVFAGRTYEAAAAGADRGPWDVQLKGIYVLIRRVGVHLDALAGDRDATFGFTPAEWTVFEDALRGRWQALTAAKKRWDFTADDDVARMMFRLTHLEHCKVMDAALAMMRATGANENDFPAWG